MFTYKTLEQNEKKYLVKSNGEVNTVLGVLQNDKFRSTISTPQIKDSKDLKELTKADIANLGYIFSKNSSLQIVGSDLKIDTSFLLDEQSYIQDIDVIKNIVLSGASKQKGMLIFENNNTFQSLLKSRDIDFELYNKSNLKIKYADLNEKILLDVLSLGNREQSVLASFIQYKEQNKENAQIGIPALDGSNWLYDLFIVEPSTLAQQFRIPEYNIKMLKTAMLQLNRNDIVSNEYSNINDIIQKVDNGKIIIIDVKDEDKKFIKATLSNIAKDTISIVDNIFHKYDKLQYLLYDAVLFSNTTKEFKSFILNKNSYNLKDELIEMHYYFDELKYLDFEYLLLKNRSFPIIVTAEEFKTSNLMKKNKITTNTTVGFF